MRNLSSKSLGFILCLFLMDGCGATLGGNPEVSGTAPEPSPDPTTNSASLSFAITDAPVEAAKHVYITVESVAVLKADGEWLSIPLQTTAEIDLLHFQGALYPSGIDRRPSSRHLPRDSPYPFRN